MSIESVFRTLYDRVDMEYGLLFLMLISASYMIWESFNFRIGQAATFPRLTAGFVVIGTILLLLRPILPEPIYSFVAKDARALDVSEDFEEQTREEEDTEPDEVTSLSTVDRPLPDAVFTTLAAIGYVIGGYVAGLFIMTPIFVAVYTSWFRVELWVRGVLVAISVAIAYAFLTVLNVSIDEGEFLFTGGLL